MNELQCVVHYYYVSALIIYRARISRIDLDSVEFLAALASCLDHVRLDVKAQEGIGSVAKPLRHEREQGSRRTSHIDDPTVSGREVHGQVRNETMALSV